MDYALACLWRPFRCRSNEQRPFRLRLKATATDQTRAPSALPMETDATASGPEAGAS